LAQKDDLKNLYASVDDFTGMCETMIDHSGELNLAGFRQHGNDW